MLNLCLVRHAIAVPRGTPGMPDDQRPLTDQGRARMKLAAAGLRELVKVDAVVSSPLLRARETAKILLEAWGLRELHLSDALATGDDDRLLRDLEGVDGDTIAAVGHEPHISRTLAYLVAGRQEAFGALFKKGAGALVRFDGRPGPGTGQLEWLLQPAALRALGRPG